MIGYERYSRSLAGLGATPATTFTTGTQVVNAVDTAVQKIEYYIGRWVVQVAKRPELAVPMVAWADSLAAASAATTSVKFTEAEAAKMEELAPYAYASITAARAIQADPTGAALSVTPNGIELPGEEAAPATPTAADADQKAYTYGYVGAVGGAVVGYLIGKKSK